MSLRKRVKDLENKMQFQIINQNLCNRLKWLECKSNGGHQFKFSKIVNFDWRAWRLSDYYLFECSCGASIEKERSELTAKEKKALQDLGVLDAQNQSK